MKCRALFKYFIVGILFLAFSPTLMAGDQRHTAVGVLKSRQHLIEIFNNDSEPRYNVKSINGEMLAEYVTESEVLNQFPELESIIGGYADDASLTLPKDTIFDDM